MTKILTMAVAALALSAGTARTQSDAVPSCDDLKQVILLSASRDKFASIVAKPREGNFSDTSLPLDGWKDCSIYGLRTYTCDSEALKSADDAEKALAKIVQDIKTCLQNTWSQDQARSSSDYIVLHHPIGFVSMTVSTDQKQTGQHVVRLIMFFRSTS
jgi:hypothetical protein